jgi:heterodisulfide reductase subunit A
MNAVNYDLSDRMMTFRVGSIVLATGFDLFDPRNAPQYGYGTIDHVYTSLEFERLLNTSGPTAGQVVLRNGTVPGSIAFISCVGSMTSEHRDYCSSVCCMVQMKQALLTARKFPGISIRYHYSNLCIPGKDSAGLLSSLQRKGGVEFMRMGAPDSIRLSEAGDKVLVSFEDCGGGRQESTADMVVLAPAMEGDHGSDELSRLTDASLGDARFYSEVHSKLNPISTAIDGIYVVGCAQGPKDIQGAVAQGQAAAGEILSKLIPGGTLSLEPMVSSVREDLCAGCQMCVGLCPYKAARYDALENRCSVNEALCRGCGVCVAACPAGAMESKHFTDVQILEEIEAVIQE